MKHDINYYELLLIEDNPGDELLIIEHLKDVFLNAKITVCKNFNDLLELYSNGNTAFIACLLDLSLPDHQGIDLIKDIQKIVLDIPVIVLTGYANLEFSIKSLELGVTDYLIKDEITSISLYKSIIYSLERKKNITKIKESEQRYSDLFNFSSEAKILFEFESKNILQVNNAAINRYEYSEDELLASSIERLFVKKEFNNYLQKVEENKKSSEHVHITKNGKKIHVEITSSELEINKKRCVLISCNDITEKIQFQKYVNETIIKTQEDERYEIGAELHDNVCQILATSQIYLSILSEKLKEEENTDCFNKVNTLIQKSLNEIRNISHQMAPAFFEDSKLSETLPILLENFNAENLMNVNVEFDAEVENLVLNEHLHLNLFRILQEQLANIRKYSKANNVNIQINNCFDFICMKIEDDGIGFNKGNVKKGIGLTNMERRVGLLNGEIIIESEINKGCLISIKLPISSISKNMS